MSKIVNQSTASTAAPKQKTRALTGQVLLDSIKRLNPKQLIGNPVMFLVEVTFFIVLALAIYPQAFYPVASLTQRPFYVAVAAILLLTVWFSSLSDSLAEKQAKNTANSLRKLESEVPVKKLVTDEWTRKVVHCSSKSIAKGDLLLLERNDVVPSDAEVLEGIAMVDESLLTGESVPVRKAPGDTLIGGSKIASDTLTAKVTVNPEESLRVNCQG